MAYCAIYTVTYAIYYFYFYFYIEQTLSEFSYCPGKKTNKQTKKKLNCWSGLCKNVIPLGILNKK